MRQFEEEWEQHNDNIENEVKDEVDDLFECDMPNHVNDEPEVYMDGGDYSIYGKVKNEEEEEGEYKYEDEERNRMLNRNEEDNFEYIYVGQSFASKEELIGALRLRSIQLKYTFRAYKSMKKLFGAKCCVPECKWKVRAILTDARDTF